MTASPVEPTGLIVGRFVPPHLGHRFLIDASAARVERLVVMVNGGPDDAVPGELRARWLQEDHPRARVILVRHELKTDFNDAGLWARWVALFQAHWPYDDGPHIVFSSEQYGVELAARLGARPVVIDVSRASIPVSGTMIRTDPAAHLQFLSRPVRAWVEEKWCAS